MHNDEGTLMAFLDGELPVVERDEVERHVRECPSVRLSSKTCAPIAR